MTALIILVNVVFYLIWAAICTKHFLKNEDIYSIETFEKAKTPDIIFCILIASLLAIIFYIPATVLFPIYLLAIKLKKLLLRLFFWEFEKKQAQLLEHEENKNV